MPCTHLMHAHALMSLLMSHPLDLAQASVTHGASLRVVDCVSLFVTDGVTAGQEPGQRATVPKQQLCHSRIALHVRDLPVLQLLLGPRRSPCVASSCPHTLASLCACSCAGRVQGDNQSLASSNLFCLAIAQSVLCEVT